MRNPDTLIVEVLELPIINLSHRLLIKIQHPTNPQFDVVPHIIEFRHELTKIKKIAIQDGVVNHLKQLGYDKHFPEVKKVVLTKLELTSTNETLSTRDIK